MIEILGIDSGSSRERERVVRDREDRVVGTAVEREGDIHVDLAADAPPTVRNVLDCEPGSGPVRLEPRFVAEKRDGELHLHV